MTRSLALLVGAAVLSLSACGGSDSSRADIAFVSSRDGDYAIFVMSADGKSERRLTKRDDEAPRDRSVFWQIDPAWSPDATKIAFASARTGEPHVYVMNADGTGVTQLTSGKTSGTHPTWSSDGSSIAFVRNGDIYVMTSDGSDPKRISDINAEESDPAWSPDGKWIAYVRRTPGTPVQNVWVMHPDGSERRALTRHQAGRTFTPAWSPDSARIVFSMSRGDDPFQLFTIGVGGKGLRSVVPAANDDFEPSWSPDGSRIAYQEEGAIFTIELGGRDVEKLTDYATNDSTPIWKPKPPPTSDAQKVP